jgi:hypothetical protein
MISEQDLERLYSELREIKNAIASREKPDMSLAEHVLQAINAAASKVAHPVRLSPVHFAALQAYRDSRLVVSAAENKHVLVVCDENAPTLDDAIKAACDDE